LHIIKAPISPTDTRLKRSLADKALEHVIARDLALSEIRRCCRLGSDESQEQDRHGHEIAKKDEKKIVKKADFQRQNEVALYHFYQYWVRIFDRRSGQRGESGKRQQNRVMSTRGTAVTEFPQSYPNFGP